MTALLCVSAEATIVLRATHGSVSLRFEGKEAICSAICTGNNESDNLDVTLSLYRGGTLVKSWSQSGTGYVTISERCGAKSGKSYTLVMQYSVNGTEKPDLSTTKTCP